jgi:hypothetical protein
VVQHLAGDTILRERHALIVDDTIHFDGADWGGSID